MPRLSLLSQIIYGKPLANLDRVQFLKSESGTLLSDSHAIDTELISKVISDMHCGKAPDIVGLTIEHLQYSHPSAVVICLNSFS